MDVDVDLCKGPPVNFWGRDLCIVRQERNVFVLLRDSCVPKEKKMACRFEEKQTRSGLQHFWEQEAYKILRSCANDFGLNFDNLCEADKTYMRDIQMYCIARMVPPEIAPTLSPDNHVLRKWINTVKILFIIKWMFLRG